MQNDSGRGVLLLAADPPVCRRIPFQLAVERVAKAYGVLSKEW
jgi:hypothetical protein